jgi:hypothetical protein
MDVAIYKNTYAQITLEDEKDIEALVMVLEFARDNCAWQSVTEFSERLLDALCEHGY